MARPIPDSLDVDLRNRSKKEVDVPDKESNKSIFDITDRYSSTSKSFMLGTCSGWVAGVSVIRVGRIAAFGVGGSIILMHFASELGYINVNWERVKESAGHSQAWLEWLLNFVKHNSCYSVGFLGGFFFVKPATPVSPVEHERPLPPEPIPPKPPEPYKPEEPHVFEKPSFLLAKPIPHSPKISPSSIPNPSPSVTTTKQVEPGYPSYGGYLYSIPGYSAFQPVNHSGMPGYHPGLGPPTQPLPTEPPNPDFLPFPQASVAPSTSEPILEEESMDTDALLMVTDDEETQQPPPQTDFEEHFTPEIISTIPTVASPEASKPQPTESKMSITSLAQGSGATVTIPSMIPNKEIKKKQERFSLKTSIPISKIDMKCVSNPPDSLFQNSLTKKSFNPTFTKDPPRVEIQSNIVIKSATKESEAKETMKPVTSQPNNSICTLINAAEAINKTDNQFRVPEPPKTDSPNETKASPVLTKPLFNPINIETSKASFNKPPDRETYTSDAKNQILFIQNKNNNNQNPKMLLTLQQQNPQVLLQRTNFDSKNLQAPSRLSSQSKRSKEDMMNESTSSKVVALKRLHQENCDENDFENLITENQIYGNKIVVKEKSQGTLQEQDLKNNKMLTEKNITTEAKNVVLQPNFLYLSNVQFPNMMIVKNNPKATQNVDCNKTRTALNENKVVNDNSTTVPTDVSVGNTANKSLKLVPPIVNKDIHVLKSTNNLIQTLSNKTKTDSSKPEMNLAKPDNGMASKSENIVVTKSDKIITKPDMVITKPDLVFQANQKVIVNPQIIYQVPISSIVESDKINQSTIMNISTKDYPKILAQHKDFSKPFEPAKTNDKLYIACPYQMDSKLQPKIVITNLRPKINKIEEVSSLDIYEKRKRLRRLKYLSNRENNVTKDIKTDNATTPTVPQSVKKPDKNEVRNANIITADNMISEIYKEFASSKGKLDEASSDSETDDCEEVESKQYENIFKEYGPNAKSLENNKRKSEFLANFRLASPETYREKELDLQDRMLKHDKVRSAYAAVGRLDVLLHGDQHETTVSQQPEPLRFSACVVAEENLTRSRKKTMFLSHLKLSQATQKYKEEYEKAWEVVVKERQRRNGTDDASNRNIAWPSLYLDTKGQLQLMTEIKQCVNENNNLIKKMLDTVREKQANDESISVLAEKNFSELNRLSKMADRSVKLVSGQNTGKRDLNPGFDSENIQKQTLVVEQPFHNYPKLNIPNISKIISLKSTHECQSAVTAPATSMDEPRSSAAGVTEMFVEVAPLTCKSSDASCQVEENSWPGVERMIKYYRDYEIGRRREVVELHRRNTALRVEGAHITRAASRDSDRARALLAERQNLALEENNLRLSLQRLRAAIDEVKNFTGLHDFC